MTEPCKYQKLLEVLALDNEDSLYEEIMRFDHFGIINYFSAFILPDDETEIKEELNAYNKAQEDLLKKLSDLGILSLVGME